MGIHYKNLIDEVIHQKAENQLERLIGMLTKLIHAHAKRSGDQRNDGSGSRLRWERERLTGLPHM